MAGRGRTKLAGKTPQAGRRRRAGPMRAFLSMMARRICGGEEGGRASAGAGGGALAASKVLQGAPARVAVQHSKLEQAGSSPSHPPPIPSQPPGLPFPSAQPHPLSSPCCPCPRRWACSPARARTPRASRRSRSLRGQAQRRSGHACQQGLAPPAPLVPIHGPRCASHNQESHAGARVCGCQRCQPWRLTHHHSALDAQGSWTPGPQCRFSAHGSPIIMVSSMVQSSLIRLRRPMTELLILVPARMREPSPMMALFTSASTTWGGGARPPGPLHGSP